MSKSEIRSITASFSSSISKQIAGSFSWATRTCGSPCTTGINGPDGCAPVGGATVTAPMVPVWPPTGSGSSRGRA